MRFSLLLVGALILTACSGPRLPAPNSTDAHYDSRERAVQVMVSGTERNDGKRLGICKPPSLWRPAAYRPVANGSPPDSTAARPRVDLAVGSPRVRRAVRRPRQRQVVTGIRFM